MDTGFDTARALGAGLTRAVKSLTGIVIVSRTFQKTNAQRRIGKLHRDGYTRCAATDDAQIVLQRLTILQFVQVRKHVIGALLSMQVVSARPRFRTAASRPW